MQKWFESEELKQRYVSIGSEKKTIYCIVLFFLLHLQELAKMLVRVLVPK